MRLPYVIRRGMLYVPASSRKFLQKSLSLAVDCVAYDLEDSVTVTRKEQARCELGAFFGQNARPKGVREVAVRINGTNTGHALDDLKQTLSCGYVDTVVVPKVQSASDLRFVTDAIRSLGPAPIYPRTQPRMIALIESAKALVSLNEICRASPLLDGLAFAAEDFCLDLSIARTPSKTELLFARSSIITAARAYNIQSVLDLVCTEIGEPGILEAECVDGRRLGFNGKQLIHPDQVATAQRVFAPTREQIEWAVRINAASTKAAQMGMGAFVLDGKMNDQPVTRQAIKTLEQASACGMDDTVNQLREQFANVEPGSAQVGA